jgi:hypothetical protein
MTTNHDAFISYSHVADLDTAQAIEKGLQRLARPWNRLRAMSVFRDSSDLSLSPHLWSSIQSHLSGSKFLIVLACPESAASVWVNREITEFCETNGSAAVLLVLTGGELAWDDARAQFTVGSTSAPPALNGRLDDQPLWLDLRWARGNKNLSLRLSQFRSAIAKLASPISGKSPEDLESDDVRQHRRALRLARAAVAALVVLGLVASVAAVLAVGNAHKAARRAREATGGQLALAALDLPASEIDRALLLSVAAGALAPTSDDITFQAGRVLIGRYSRLKALLDAGEDRQQLSVQAVALTNDGTSVVGLAKQAGQPTEVLRWEVDRRGEPAAIEVSDSLAKRLTSIGTTDTVAVGEPGGPMAFVVGGRSTSVDGTVLAFDPRSDRAAVVADDGAQRLIEVPSGKVVADLGKGTVDLGDGRVAVASDEGIRLLDSSTGSELASTSIESGRDIVAMAVGQNDQRAAVAATSTGELLRWERAGSGLTAEAAIDTPPEVGAVRELVTSEDGGRALLVGANGSAVVDLASGDVVGLGLGETGVVAADPAGRFVAVGGKRLVVWDMRSGDRVFAVPQPANVLAWSGPCDDSGLCRLVTAGESLDVWDPSTGRMIRLEDQTNAQAVAISADASMVASAGWGPAVALWSVSPLIDNSGREMLAPAGAATSVDPVTLKIARSTSATSVEIRGGDDETVRIETGAFDRFVLVPNGRRLVTTADGVLRLFDTASGATIAIDPACAGNLLTVSPDGRMLAVFDLDRPVAVVCDTSAGSLVATVRLASGSRATSVIAVDDDGNMALGDPNGLVTLLARGADGRTFVGTGVDVRPGKEPAEVRSLAIRDGVVAAGIQTPATRGAQASVLVWPTGGTPVQFVTDFLDVPAVALIGDADAVVVAGRDTSTSPVTLQTWETATRRRLGQSFTGLVGDVVVLGGDTASVVGADGSGAVYRWRSTENLTQEICRIVGRPLRLDEWNTALGGALQRYEFSPVC